MPRILPLSSALLLLAACVEGAPPELDGLWSRSDSACAIGAGVRFEADAVRVFLGRDEEVLFDAPRYKVERRGRAARITIDYALPTRPGGGSGQGGRGVLILERDAENWIRPVSHQFADKTTGAVSVRLGEEEATRFFTLHRCAEASAPAE
jgi:hypothetical protein